jgi:hypothetical protein
LYQVVAVERQQSANRRQALIISRTDSAIDEFPQSVDRRSNVALRARAVAISQIDRNFIPNKQQNYYENFNDRDA